MAKFDKNVDWFEMYMEDNKSLLQTMVRNMTSDLSAGYDYFGKSIVGQRQEIEQFKRRLDDTLDMFKAMDEAAVQRWCFYELVKKGAIS